MPPLDDLEAILTELGKRAILVGIPQEKNPRSDGVTNSMIGYVHEFGSPAQNIPARPHLIPGVQAALPEITNRLNAAVSTALKGGSADAVDIFFEQAGQMAVNSVRAVIRAGIPPPIKPETVLGRTTGHSRRRQATPRGTWTRAARAELVAGDVTPLIDTASYINSITYVVKK